MGPPAGWQLTEVDDPFKEAAAAARLAQASALKKPAIAEGITGGDPDALTHQADATGRPSADATDSNQSMLPQNTLSSSELSNNKGRVLWAKESLLSVWVSVLEMLGRIVSKLLYSLNSVFSSMEIPAWVLNLMSVLARGPMNNKLLQLYAEGGDHSRRLSSVLANGKFSSAEAGPDEPWEVSLGLPFQVQTARCVTDVSLAGSAHDAPEIGCCTLVSTACTEEIGGSYQSPKLWSRAASPPAFLLYYLCY